MTGLIALLDDIGAIAKVAAASVDDVAGQAAKAGAKAAGAVIDDAAVTPKYVHGFDASREVPIVLKIARGSIFNKVVILLPVALLLSAFAPWLISPLLMIGGAYLCFEGAEKVWHALRPGDHGAEAELQVNADGSVSLEEQRVAGAVKTDFILSAEIMTIALSTIPESDPIWMKALILLVVAVLITVGVYGFVALIVKADDFGLHLARKGRAGVAAFGRWIVRIMPGFMRLLLIVGTAAMVWVGGNIVIHGLHDLGMHQPYEWITATAARAGATMPVGAGVVEWAVTAFFDGIFGVLLGLVLIPVATKIIGPVFAAITGKKATVGH
ncbi:DUF808 domain-containing protein [Paracoccus aminophilus]|uniref:DUF808 domain-containing protein n=1 Tax=Paracoccus aminophilus JCM 7686 TaxID=1367847 RepID=S5Y1E4_PARAH|nr:DUF808 domain-containing protein [Paracoccus aminophilus]AGT09515.1 hypothetical protein JCM7686_2447 [Paracoccus aminophilus JCM 7686]